MIRGYRIWLDRISTSYGTQPIGQSGISNPDYAKRSSQQQHAIDRFCDQVAAETLVPNQDFLSRWQDNRTLEDNLKMLAAKYRVSEFVILRRAYENDKLNTRDYKINYWALMANHKKGKGKKGGGDFYVNLLARNSSTLTITLLAATAEGRLPHKDTARLLNVKVRTLTAIQAELVKRGFINA